jgi:DUF4097 and DUF4098 domain-containing protein YvlB
MGGIPVKTGNTERGTAMFTRSVVAICIVGLAVISMAGDVQPATKKFEETGKKVVALEGEQVLYVGNKRGDIILIGEEGRSEIEIVFTKKVRAENEAEAKKIAGGMDIVFKRKNGELIIVAEYPEADNARKSILSIILQRDPRFSMDFKIMVPSNMIMKAKTSSGDIAVFDAGRDIGLSAASGDVVVERIGGYIEIGVSSGDIEIKDAAGCVKVNSASGDISAEEVAGDMEVRTSNGDVDLDGIEGDLVIATSSGDVTVKGVGGVKYKGSGGEAKFYGVRGPVSAGAASGDMIFHLEPRGNNDYNVRTSSGEIDLRFIEKIPGGYVLKASTTNGDISVNLPIKITKVGRHYIAGVVRDGESVVTLETVSGDITVAEDEE